MRIPQALGLLLALLLLPSAHALTVTSTGSDCAVTGGACGGDGIVCSPVFLEFELRPFWVTPVLRPECIEQAVQNVRELVGV